MNNTIANYVRAMEGGIAFPSAAVEQALEVLMESELILTCGNGGSAATAIHFASDLRSIGLTAFDMLSPSKLTQIGNDQGWAYIFSMQALPKSTVVAFSCSGTSPNVERLFYADVKQLILFTSRMKEGNRAWDLHPHLAERAIIIEVDTGDYELAEDAHLILCHALKKAIKERLT